MLRALGLLVLGLAAMAAGSLLFFLALRRLLGVREWEPDEFGDVESALRDALRAEAEAAPVRDLGLLIYRDGSTRPLAHPND